jgi:5-methylcytosine-specific restriction protein A
MKPYNYRWQQLRKRFLRDHPLCSMCLAQGRLEDATVVDHIKAHRGGDELFWDPDNWQALCKQHHDGAKQSEDKRGFSTAVGADGWPLDPRHPVNRQR